MANPKDLNSYESIESVVRSIGRGTLEKYVLEPSKSQRREDLLVGLKRFFNDIRWEEFWMKKKKEEEETNRKTVDSNENRNTSPTSITDRAFFQSEKVNDDDDSFSALCFLNPFCSKEFIEMMELCVLMEFGV